MHANLERAVIDYFAIQFCYHQNVQGVLLLLSAPCFRLKFFVFGPGNLDFGAVNNADTVRGQMEE
jgi:hypothetical protein